MKTRVPVVAALLVGSIGAVACWGNYQFRRGYSAAEQAVEDRRREIEMYEYYAGALPAALENIQRLRTELAGADTAAEERRICDLLAGAIFDYGYMRRDYVRALGGRTDLFSYEGALRLGMRNKLPRLEEVPRYWHPDESRWLWDKQSAIRGVILEWNHRVPENWRPNLAGIM